jgi:hypothetical protein
MEHPNAELYRRVTAAFQSGDIDTVRSALAPGLRWHEAGNPEIMGRDAVLQQMSGAPAWPPASTSSPHATRPSPTSQRSTNGSTHFAIDPSSAGIGDRRPARRSASR